MQAAPGQIWTSPPKLPRSVAILRMPSALRWPPGGQIRENLLRECQPAVSTIRKESTTGKTTGHFDIRIFSALTSFNDSRRDLSAYFLYFPAFRYAT
jgi:hypothetical protein